MSEIHYQLVHGAVPTVDPLSAAIGLTSGASSLPAATHPGNTLDVTTDGMASGDQVNYSLIQAPGRGVPAGVGNRINCDQRGVPFLREFNDRANIGAFELIASGIFFRTF